MAAPSRLGVQKNSSGASLRGASLTFDACATALRRDIEWMAGQPLTETTLQRFLDRVAITADALDDEAKFLRQRADLRDTNRPEPVPLLGVAVDGDRGPELFSLDETIDTLTRASRAWQGEQR